MQFDNATLVLNDSVYDVAQGAGTVIELREDLQKFRVSFGTKNYLYTLGGVSVYPQKTLYWRDPIAGVIPPKAVGAWEKYVLIRNFVAQTLGL